MREDEPVLYEREPGIGEMLGSYAVWLGLSALVIWLMLQLRLNLLDVVVALQLGPWVLMAIDRFGVIILGLGAIGAVVLLEHYLRMGLKRKRFWARAGTALLTLAVLLGFSYAFQFAIRGFG